MTYKFDSEKEEDAAKKLLRRLSKGGINDQQALTFMQTQTRYKDDRSFKNFLKTVKTSDNFPVRKKGEKLVRTDIFEA